MNHVGFIPKQTLRPLSYQPMRAGQFRGFGGCNVFPSNNTIINNNIYGGMSGGCYDMSYGYGGGCCDGGGSNKFMNWMMGIGLGTTLLGGILNMFGIGGGGAVERTAGDDADVDDADDADNNDTVDTDKQKFDTEKAKLEETLKTMGLDPAKGSVLKDADGNFKYTYDGKTFDSLDDLREGLKKKEENPSVVTPEEDPNKKPANELPEVVVTGQKPTKPGTGTGTGATAATSKSTPKAPSGWDVIHATGTRNNSYMIDADNKDGQGVDNDASTVDVVIDKYFKAELKKANISMNAEGEKYVREQIIKNNPNIFDKDGKVKKNADWDSLVMPSTAVVKTSKFANMNAYSVDNKNQFIGPDGKPTGNGISESSGMFSGDAYVKINGQNYKLRTADGDNLNFDKLKIENGKDNQIHITNTKESDADYRVISLLNPKTGKSYKMTTDNSGNMCIVTTGNKLIPLADILSKKVNMTLG